jgi:hypothetical protein
VSVSIMTLTAISYERYYAIVYPLKLNATKFRAKMIVLFVWILALIVSTPPIIFYSMANDDGRK